MSWSDSLIYNYFDISLLDDFDNEYYSKLLKIVKK